MDILLGIGGHVIKLKSENQATNDNFGVIQKREQNMKSDFKSPRVVPEGYLRNVYTGRVRPEIQPLTLLHTSFHEKGTPFVYLLLTNGAPFKYLVYRILHFVTTVNALSFK